MNSLLLKIFKGKRLHAVVVLLALFLISYLIPYTTVYTSLRITKTTIKGHEEEKYLAYLPHSGLSNQRIELSNALLLAYMLNRTLIIPPAFLGTVFGWSGRDQLLEKLEWLTSAKDFPKLCQQPTPGKLFTYVERSGCAEYKEFGVIPWTELHDLHALRALGIKFVLQDSVSMDSLKRQLNITSNSDMYLHRDTQLYDWRLYENRTLALDLLKNKLNYFDSFAGRRYYKILLPRHFQRRKEKLLYLGGIFGSTRMNVAEPKHIIIQEKIKQIMVYRMDTLLGKTVQLIVDHLGGKGSYMSLHFRTGDNPFRREIPDNLQAFTKNMTELILQNETYVSDENCLSIQYNQQQRQQQQQQQQQQVYNFDTNMYHRAKIYMATDHRNPRGETSQLLPWFNTFPCTSILNDLPENVFTPLESIRDIIEPSKSLKRFLIPIVDAMVAAHGKQILTTPRSTFSRYINELHQAWVPSFPP